MKLSIHLCASACIYGSLLALPAEQCFAQDEAQPPAKPVVVNDPIARDLLATNPTEPREIMNVVNLLVDLHEPQAAVALVQKLEAAGLDESQLAALHAEFGTPSLLKLTLDPVLRPVAGKFVESVLAAGEKVARDPDFLAAQIERLKSPNAGERTQALAALTRGREAAVSALLAVLKDPARDAEFNQVRTALVALGGDAVEALGAVLEGKHEALSLQAVSVLSLLPQPDAELFLLSAAYAPHQSAAVRRAAAAYLPKDASKSLAGARFFARATKLLARQSPLDERADGTAVIWRWNAEAEEAQPTAMPAAQASYALAAQFAARARAITPGNPELNRLYLAAVLEGAALAAGFDKPMPPEDAKIIEDLVASDGVGPLVDLLAEALRRDRPLVATMAARILGDVATADILRTPDSRMSPLVQAARSGDRRTRFAATEAIIRLEPQGPFPGDSFVAESIEFFVRSHGRPRALAGDLLIDEARSLAAMLMGAGFEPEAAAGHYPFLRAAIASPDYELFVLDYLLASKDSAQLLQDLRHDNRTTAVPIVVVADAADMELAGTLALREPRVLVVERPEGINTARLLAARALETFGGRLVSGEERMKQAVAAITWATKSPLAANMLAPCRSFDPILEQALWQPELRAAAMALIVERGKASGQRALVELASSGTEALATRQVAAQAFADSVKRHGTLLTTYEIAQQYDRYNGSETQPKEVQAVFAAVLDAIEKKG